MAINHSFEHTSEIGEGLDVIELGRGNERSDNGPAISATEAPSGRSSIPISLARLGLAGGCLPLALAVAKSARSAVGLEPERACCGLS